MTKRRRGSRQREAVPKGVLKKPRPVWFVTLMAFVLPGSGQVFNGAPARGVIMQFGIVFGAWISYELTTPDTSPLGRMAGGLLVYVFSIVDANGIAKLRVKAWERIQVGQPPRHRKGMATEAAVESLTSGTHDEDVGDSVGREGRPPGDETAECEDAAGSEDGAGSEPVSS